MAGRWNRSFYKALLYISKLHHSNQKCRQLKSGHLLTKVTIIIHLNTFNYANQPAVFVFLVWRVLFCKCHASLISLFISFWDSLSSIGLIKCHSSIYEPFQRAVISNGLETIFFKEKLVTFSVFKICKNSYSGKKATKFSIGLVSCQILFVFF